jgi:hypothetical protein
MSKYSILELVNNLDWEKVSDLLENQEVGDLEFESKLAWL